MNLPILLRGVAWSMVSVLIFSGWFVATRFMVTNELRIWDVLALRFGVAVVILLPFFFARKERLIARAGEGLLYAILWGAPFILLLTYGLQLTSAAAASSVTPTVMPVFAGLIGWMLLREKLSLAKIVGYLTIWAVLAVLIRFNPVKNVESNPLGFIPLIVAAAMWAFYSVRFRRSDLTPLESASLMCFWSAVMIIPPYLYFGLSRLHLASPGELLFQVVYQGLLTSIVAIVSFNRAITLIGSRAAAAIIAFVPVVTALMAIPILGEVPSLMGAVAIATIAVGVIVTALPPRAPAKGKVVVGDA